MFALNASPSDQAFADLAEATREEKFDSKRTHSHEPGLYVEGFVHLHGSFGFHAH